MKRRKEFSGPTANICCVYAPPPPPAPPACSCGDNHTVWSFKDKENLCWACIMKRRENEKEVIDYQI